MTQPKRFAADIELRTWARKPAEEALWKRRAASEPAWRPLRISPTQVVQCPVEARHCPDCGANLSAPDREVVQGGPRCPCEDGVFNRALEESMDGFRPAMLEKLWEGAGVPSRFRSCTFDTFRTRPGVEKALASCRGYAESFSPDTKAGLWLMGSFGTGKTHLATAICRATIERTLAGAWFTTAADLVAAVRPAPGERDFNWEWVDDAINAELLILDDVGQEQSSPFARDVIYRVLNGRYEAERPFVLTTNAGDAQLEERLGGAAVSRLYEMTQPLILKAKDYRAELARSRSAA